MSHVVDGSVVSEIRNLAISAHTPATQIPSVVVPRDHEVLSLKRHQLMTAAMPCPFLSAL
ncbi:hypothetical protein [Pectobacterium versatile]|uniref:hypothetical protein n=1 Tax=Pectobacterium versatile TaxID=2488639 RepID=UPI00383B6C75